MSSFAREDSKTSTPRNSSSPHSTIDDIELALRLPLPPSSSTIARSLNSESREGQGLALKPVDKGFGAWSFLAGAFVVETIVWGFPNAYGVFLSVYLDDPKFGSQPHASSILPLVGTLSSGIIYCSSKSHCPFWNAYLRRYPRHRRPAMWLGAIACFASLFGASYARTVNELVALQGVLYALGASLTYQPTISYMSEWFVERRGTANGIMFAGTALGGLFLPLILPPLISAHGTSVTLRYLSVAVIALLIPAIPFIKPRLPESRVHGPGRREDNTTWMTDWRLWALLCINTIQGFAYFVPIVYLPTFTSAVNSSTTVSALAVALLNGASVFGRVILGALSDRVSPWLLATCALLLSSISTFVLWGVAGSATAGVLVFGITYGLVAGGWSSLWNGFVKPLSKGDPTRATSLFSILLLSRGLGNVLSTPISTALAATSSQAVSHSHTGFKVDGGRYESMIVYVGTCFAVASTLTAAGFVRERSVAKRSA
ncbi:MFS general substrate transporter [Peniophora sp. CONT]|nr:MFS general substrate transporter [Peniophora sp. CONT]